MGLVLTQAIPIRARPRNKALIFEDEDDLAEDKTKPSLILFWPDENHTETGYAGICAEEADCPARRIEMKNHVGNSIQIGMIIFFAFFLGGEETVVERINKVGSAFYGPILAAFVTGVMIRRVQGRAMVIGILAGVGINLMLWLGFEDDFWMWWNLTGCVVAVVIAVLVSLIRPQNLSYSGSGQLLIWDTDVWKEERRWLPVYCSLMVFFAGLVVLCTFLPGFLTPG